MTQYYASGNTYTFDIKEAYNTRCGIVCYGKCRENGRFAWVDDKGIQFVGEKRFEAQKIAEAHIPVGCQMW